MNKWLTICISIVISTFIAINSILLFTNKSIITRSYYVNEYDRVFENTYAQQLEKESVVVPSQEMIVTIDVEAVSEFNIVPGDTVQKGIELAQLKSDAADKQRELWEAEQQAYSQEQSQLQQIIGSLQSERAGAESTSSSSGSTTGNTTDDVIDVNVQVDVNVAQDGNYAQAIAEAEQKLAEVERKLQIVSTQLGQETRALALLSPIDGNVANIEERNGKYFIQLYSNEKSVVTFANEVEWHELKEGQKVKNYSTHQKGVAEGTVSTKTEVPANETDWLKAYKHFGNDEQVPLYEVRIQLDDQLEKLPYAANTNSVITTNEVENAVRVKSKWLLERNEQQAEVYTLTNEGRIVRAPITVPFELNQYAILSEGIKQESVVLNAEPKKDNSLAFLPFPLDLPTWNSIKAVSWKDYMKYSLSGAWHPNIHVNSNNREN
ncbi:efflux RND transporter periplasmic adaptor subunit [Psychrobacillus vulpis]|uniref:Efflux RND transporter periplasmic adaptor subunit n=1 Tax=Psychrobacillus vulpis TaxID=2325572 RepID=A0A544TUT5_9BACI|nr:efflux RND transporter periplasmic adaptor subunit [Psychrobacillus vulpis]TQR21197.1 efflux RND transporter periplasmic adaptor subunit [Psychrobacillus vulpis]